MTPEFLDSADGTRLRVVRWGEGTRDVLIVGGLAEHAGRYDHVGKAFAAAGWRATCVELRGHGHSGGRRSHVDAWSQYTDDIRAAANLLRAPWCLVAHSMGGLASLDAIRGGLRPHRVALSNPLVGVQMEVPRLKVAAGRLLSRAWPTLALANELDPSALSRDPEVGRAYLADPLIYGKVTTRWYTEMVAAQARVASAGYDVPMGFFLAPEDPITSYRSSKALADRTRSYVKEYPGMRHEIFNEIGKEGAIADVIGWLSA